jgi:hypothetical protein
MISVQISCVKILEPTNVAIKITVGSAYRDYVKIGDFQEL